jgi:imidazolonepropionase-like amidohydrolase
MTLQLKQIALIDGTGRLPQEWATLVIREGRIVYVGEEAGWQARPDEALTLLDLPGLFVLLSGKLLSIISAGATSFEGMYREAGGPTEVRKAAREQLKAGADLIKVLATGAVLTPGENPEAVQFEQEEMRAALTVEARVRWLGA